MPRVDRARTRRYLDLNSRFAELSDAQIQRLLGGPRSSDGWGETTTIDFEGHKVFVKRLPVTDLEAEHAYSTKNRYRLPTYYNYGVGSAGFGAFRELLTHVKTTNWVLAGDHIGFPMMFHHRLIRGHGSRQQGGLGIAGTPEHKGYVERWNSSAAVGRFMVDRSAARHEVIVMLEWFPATLYQRLDEDQSFTPRALGQLFDTVSFLRANGILHMDAHYNNVVADGRQVYLTDHGLALDTAFDLSAAERRFHAAHDHYDYGLPVASLLWVLDARLRAFSDRDREAIFERHGIGAGEEPLGRAGPVLAEIGSLVRDDALALHPALARALVRYRDVIVDVHSFLLRLRADRRKRSRYDDQAFADLLRAVSIPV